MWTENCIDQVVHHELRYSKSLFVLYGSVEFRRMKRVHDFYTICGQKRSTMPIDVKDFVGVKQNK